MSIVTSFYNKYIWLSPYFENIVQAVLYDCWQEDISFSDFIQPSFFENHKTFKKFLVKQHVKIALFYKIKVKTSLARECTADLLAKYSMLFLNMLNKLSCSKTYLQMKYCTISKIGGISLQAEICRISWHLFSLPPMLAWERVRILQNLFVKQGISPLFVDENLTHGRLVILQSVSMMFEFPMKN